MPNKIEVWQMTYMTKTQRTASEKLGQTKVET